MKFDDKIGSIQQILTATNVGILRRQAILKELNLKKGQTVIDIGCGGGHLVEEISMCIGSSGRAIGVDPSEFQIKTAKERCKPLPNVQFLCSKVNLFIFFLTIGCIIRSILFKLFLSIDRSFFIFPLIFFLFSRLNLLKTFFLK